MVSTAPTPSTLVLDTWVKGTWADFLGLIDHPNTEKARFYYDIGWMRIETMPIGSAHSQSNSLLAAVVSLYGTLKDIKFVSFTNGSFRKQGEQECQPDLAYYIGPELQRPTQNNQPIDIDSFGPPTLAIEISATTLSDDLGQKRLLYERLGVAEYWVVNVEDGTVFAFEVANGGSRQIQVSSVLPGLAIAVIKEALNRSQTDDDGAVNRWLLKQFSES
ncbi:Uma2 family endonuclease [Leptothoe spongobia TAU-MAC 1115]|uniref:Uma2 family endonuclease n=2 Tax=Leptothoe TaxID=2651725 RepID=A0A947DHB5_9CYAN|nr:Uma2 family endonuclease [Leptothoe spongobia TAU-MAC 1115]